MIDLFLNPLGQFNKVISQIVFALATALIGLIVLALTMSAVTRYVSGNGYDWFIELPPAMVTWLVFPLLGPLFRSGQHISVDFVTVFLSNTQVAFLKFLTHVVTLIAAVIFTQAGIEATQLYIQLGELMELEIEIPVWWIYLAFPVGFIILGLISLELILLDLKTFFAKNTGK
ncbi:MAG: TRAP transporter small permease subunit [Planktomarina sp.]|jgi:TRAP-type C4-dicarboxylate transport system permease small subunit|nr:TRAP transporter small permease subunit [Planktomarina sp.]MDT2084075.1 TRAP transporter small permease subunit [Planktomarina sp.]|tara:strand:- start:52 stop:570 length:519 start_codon:yes stop_codon:yes gene_type:complete